MIFSECLLISLFSLLFSLPSRLINSALLLDGIPEDTEVNAAHRRRLLVHQ